MAYSKKPEKKLIPLEQVDTITVGRVKAYLEELRSDRYKLHIVQPLIDKWELRLVKLQKSAVKADHIAYLAHKHNPFNND